MKRFSTLVQLEKYIWAKDKKLTVQKFAKNGKPTTLVHQDGTVFKFKECIVEKAEVKIGSAKGEISILFNEHHTVMYYFTGEVKITYPKKFV